MADPTTSHGHTEIATSSGVPVEAVYTATSLGALGLDSTSRLGGPGEFPFTRGIREDGYRSTPWVMGQYSGYATPRQTNERIRSLIANGQRGFSIALDLPTQNGVDADDPLAKGEVGKVGVPLSSVGDMVEILDGIPLDQVKQVRTTANSIAPIVLAYFVVASERLGYSTSDFKVMFQNDVLKEYVARGTQIFPAPRGLEFSVDVIEYCAKHLPHWEPIEFCGYHIRDSGANAVQECAIATANAMEYIDAALRRGLEIDQFAENLFMFLSADVEIFEEVAKFRAMRRLWAHLMRDQYQAQKPESMALNLFVYTLGGSLTAQEPLNNIARVAFQALAAVLGGVQTLATSSYDEALGIPTAEAARVSLRAQQIIAHETGVAKTADPLGGSYFVESLTAELEERIRAYLDLIGEKGGALAALESGWLAEQIERSAYEQQLGFESGAVARVGVNVQADDGPRPGTAPFTIDPTTEAEQVEKLRDLRTRRDAEAVRRTLDGVAAAARSGRNTIPSIIDAVRADATMGEVVTSLKGEWGTYRHLGW